MAPRHRFSLTPVHGPYDLAEQDPSWVAESLAEAASLLADPKRLADLIASIGDEVPQELRFMLPAHRRDLILALAGDAEAQERLSVRRA